MVSCITVEVSLWPDRVLSMLNWIATIFPRVIFAGALFSCVLLDGYRSKIKADEAVVAVASNFAGTLEKLKQEFENESPHRILISIGSSGGLYAQIINGAPFDIFLSADQARPILLEKAKKIVPSSRMTYATGILTLWSANAKMMNGNGREVLRRGDFSTLAIANPALAPYGRAAREVLISLGVLSALKSKIVEGQNIAQTFSFVITGNAQLGLVALSYVINSRNKISGSRWDVPVDLYQPIRQDGVIIAGSEKNLAAVAFMKYLKSEKAQALILRHGYSLE